MRENTRYDWGCGGSHKDESDWPPPRTGRFALVQQDFGLFSSVQMSSWINLQICRSGFNRFGALLHLGALLHRIAAHAAMPLVHFLSNEGVAAAHYRACFPCPPCCQFIYFHSRAPPSPLFHSFWLLFPPIFIRFIRVAPVAIHSFSFFYAALGAISFV